MKKIAVLCACLLLAACNKNPQSTESVHFNTTVRHAIDASLAAISDAGLHYVATENAGSGGVTLIAMRSQELSIWGGQVNVMIFPDATGTTISVISDSVVGVGEQPHSYSRELLAGIGRHLGGR